MSDTIESQDDSQTTEGELQKEFTMLTELSQHPGFVAFKGTMTQEFDKITDKLFSDETAVIDIGTFFLQQETIATAKVLRRYTRLVDDRLGELKEELERHQRDRTQQS